MKSHMARVAQSDGVMSLLFLNVSVGMWNLSWSKG